MLHINRFIERLQGFDARGVKDFTMSVKDAKDLHADITRLLLKLETLQQTPSVSQDPEVVKIELTGGSF